MASGPIVILKTGETVPEARAIAGDFPEIFQRALGDWPGGYRVLDPTRGELLPPARGVAGILVTGSAASITEDPGWMGEAGGWLLGAAQLGVPVLGICFGHQLLADAFGGVVERSPAGRESGTVEVALSEAGRADPLFAGLGETLLVQQAHSDAVTTLPAGAVVLASNAHTPNQAFALGESVRAVQFHPEFDAALSAAYVEARADLVRSSAEGLGEEGEAALARVRASIRESSDGARILSNWRYYYLESGERRSA
ncbi:MAG: glutamine amidotransferase [Deltaproteobacteria bacterium]|nr:glutamine amidotransferase [Deltaproteobacteria bacterium]